MASRTSIMIFTVIRVIRVIWIIRVLTVIRVIRIISEATRTSITLRNPPRHSRA